MMADEGFVLQGLKQANLAAYLSVLYQPAEFRRAIAAIWAFDAEIARIPHLVSEPMPGEIRIQWWRDLLKSGDNAGSGPLARELIQAIIDHDLPREMLDSYLEARIFDLYQDAMPNKSTLEGYLGETVSSLFLLSILCTGAQRSTELADACGHAGMAMGLAKLLAENARFRARQQVYLPAEFLNANLLERESWLHEGPDSRHRAVIKLSIDLAENHLEEAKQAIGALEQFLQPHFLQLACTSVLLKKLRASGNSSFIQPVTLSPLSIYWRIFSAALRKN
ncbi:MAG: squalene/phytoene synthase family protein [Pseudomonadota bacterium]